MAGYSQLVFTGCLHKTMTTTSIASIVKYWVNNTTTEFPVDFDLLWQGLGYSTKANALRKFESAGFLSQSDFIKNDEVRNRQQGGSTEAHKYFLTVDAAKSFCMMANTDAGKIVRGYFLQCERELKVVLAKPPVTSLSLVESMQLANESLAREIKLYQSNLPGLIAHYEEVTNANKTLAPGKRTLKQIVDGYGATVELGMLSSLGRHIASVYRDLWHEEPETTWEDGRSVAAYPYTIDKCVETWLRGRGYLNRRRVN